MSSAEIDACVEILEDQFGPIAAAVGSVLLSEAVPLPAIFQRLRNRFRFAEVSSCEVVIIFRPFLYRYYISHVIIKLFWTLLSSHVRFSM